LKTWSSYVSTVHADVTTAQGDAKHQLSRATSLAVDAAKLHRTLEGVMTNLQVEHEELKRQLAAQRIELHQHQDIIKRQGKSHSKTLKQFGTTEELRRLFDTEMERIKHQIDGLAKVDVENSSSILLNSTAIEELRAVVGGHKPTDLLDPRNAALWSDLAFRTAARCFVFDTVQVERVLDDKIRGLWTNKMFLAEARIFISEDANVKKALDDHLRGIWDDANFAGQAREFMHKTIHVPNVNILQTEMEQRVKHLLDPKHMEEMAATSIAAELKRQLPTMHSELDTLFTSKTNTLMELTDDCLGQLQQASDQNKSILCDDVRSQFRKQLNILDTATKKHCSKLQADSKSAMESFLQHSVRTMHRLVSWGSADLYEAEQQYTTGLNKHAAMLAKRLRGSLH
jgi:hypothetical protein